MKLCDTNPEPFHAVEFPRMAATCAAGLLLSASGLSLGDQNQDLQDRHVIEYSRAQVLLQLNDTDGDLGFHARMDGDPWQRLTIETPHHRRIFEVQPRRELKLQGMTEIAFESHEPPFDELNPDAFFSRFPIGEYPIKGRTLDGRLLRSNAPLSHVIPAPATNIMAGGTSIEFDCEDDTPPVIASPHTISWDPVTSSHPTIGPASELSAAGYELVVERVEVLVIADNGNETGREACFISAG